MESAVKINSTLGRQGFNNTKLGHLQCYCVEILIKVQLGRISVAQMHYIYSHACTFNISNRYSSVTTTTYYKAVHYPTGRYNQEATCLLHGTNWILNTIITDNNFPRNIGTFDNSAVINVENGINDTDILFVAGIVQ